MSLSGRHILITRPHQQGVALAKLLSAEGAVPELFALIDVQPCPEALSRLAIQANAADWLIFISPSAVDCAWPALANLSPKVRLACIGASSATKLEQLAQRPVLHAQQGSDSAALLAETAMQSVAGQHIMIVRGVGGRAELSQVLRTRGAQVSFAEIYQRRETRPDWQPIDSLLQQQKLDACIVTSSEIADRLFHLAGSARIPALQCLQYCVPHPRIAEHLAALGAVRIVTTRADNQAMVAGLREWFSRHP
jgi:uroporphyrinogen-III synthase